MKSRHILVFALGVFIGCLLVAAIEQSAWLRTPAALALLLSAVLVLLLLAVLFAQTAIACLGILVALAAGLSHYALFIASDPRMASAVIFTACLYLPLFAVFLADAPECPPFSPNGAFRILLTVSFLPVCLLAYAILSLAEPPGGMETVMLHAMASWLPIPLPGFLACASAAVYLATGRHNHLERAQWFASALVMGAVSMTFRSSLWPDSGQPAMLVWNTLGTLLLLAGAALDAGWRHANVDDLTQLPSRRPLNNHMQRLQAPYVVAVVDVDHFKSVNDRFGHDVGDQVLRFVASRLRLVHESSGVPYRYGGEEFVIVLPGHNAASASRVLDDLRQCVASKPFIVRGSDRPRSRPGDEKTPNEPAAKGSVTVTVSIGFAVAGEHYETPSDVLIAADKALYQAKEEGRNRVVQKG